VVSLSSLDDDTGDDDLELPADAIMAASSSGSSKLFSASSSNALAFRDDDDDNDASFWRFNDGSEMGPINLLPPNDSDDDEVHDSQWSDCSAVVVSREARRRMPVKVDLDERIVD
jgi:hypothetical protein